MVVKYILLNCLSLIEKTLSKRLNNMKSQVVLSKQSPQLGKRHLEVMDELESMLDKGKSFSTMSDLAKQLKMFLNGLN